jgi:hypothetical protein
LKKVVFAGSAIWRQQVSTVLPLEEIRCRMYFSVKRISVVITVAAFWILDFFECGTTYF